MKKDEVQKHYASGNCWQSKIFAEFESSMSSKNKPFPCVFGVTGFNSGQLRFSFVDELNANNIAPILASYLRESKSIGQNTSLIVFSRPAPVLSLDFYEKRFWQILLDLSQIDSKPWPKDIPEHLNHPAWEFCFEGEPIFVVCNTPAHVMRQSRRSSTFILTFQPRWVFEDILGTAEAAHKSTTLVRKRLKNYDLVSPCPHLGLYGDEKNREYKQYFLRDDNGEVSCPFQFLHKKRS